MLKINELKMMDLASEHNITVTIDKANPRLAWFDMDTYRIHKDRCGSFGKQRVWRVSERGEGMLLTFCDNIWGQPLTFTRANAMKFAIDRILKSRELNRAAS